MIRTRSPHAALNLQERAIWRTEVLRVRQSTLASDPPLPVAVDGVVGRHTPSTVRLWPAALTVVDPPTFATRLQRALAPSGPRRRVGWQRLVVLGLGIVTTWWAITHAHNRKQRNILHV